jgi:hypothetical protein
MVHAYLMYGYPTQTIQETVTVEMVRQLFEVGVLQSDLASVCDDRAQSCWLVSREIWCGKGNQLELSLITILIIPIQQESIMINSVLDSKKSLFNFMHGICFDYELQDWSD